MHSGPFGFLTKLIAKWAELVQKFVPRSCVRIFSNERTRSTPIRPETDVLVHFALFGCIRDCLVALRNSVHNGTTLVQKFVPRRRFGIFRNEHTRSNPLDPKLTVWCVSYYLGASGTVWLPCETRCKMGELVQKFMPRSRVGIIRNERTRSTPIGP